MRTNNDGNAPATKKRIIAVLFKQILAALIVLTYMVSNTLQAQSHAASQPQTIHFGLYPYLSPNMLQHRMQPLIDYIEDNSSFRVQRQQTSSYQRFLERARAGEFQLLYAPSHFAADLSLRHGHRPVLLLDFSYQALLISLKSGDIRHFDDISGRSLAIPNIQAAVSRTVLQQLNQQTLAPPPRLLKKSTHDRTLHALLSGEAEVALISSATLDSLPASSANKLHIIKRYGDLLGDIILLQEQGPQPAATSLAGLLSGFPTSKEAAEFYRRWKINFIAKPIDREQLRPMLELAPK